MRSLLPSCEYPPRQTRRDVPLWPIAMVACDGAASHAGRRLHPHSITLVRPPLHRNPLARDARAPSASVSSSGGRAAAATTPLGVTPGGRPPATGPRPFGARGAAAARRPLSAAHSHRRRLVGWQTRRPARPPAPAHPLTGGTSARGRPPVRLRAWFVRPKGWSCGRWPPSRRVAPAADCRRGGDARHPRPIRHRSYRVRISCPTTYLNWARRQQNTVQCP